MSVKDTNGMTALHYAAMDNPDPEMITVLIGAGAKDITNNSGRTALTLAAMMNNSDVVTALLDAGSDVHAKDMFGRTALDNARENTKLKGSPILRRLEEITEKRG